MFQDDWRIYCKQTRWISTTYVSFTFKLQLASLVHSVYKLYLMITISRLKNTIKFITFLGTTRKLPSIAVTNNFTAITSYKDNNA